MENLNFVENQLIPVNQDEAGVVIVSGRSLHEFLQIKTPYKKWFDRMIEYGFNENIDFAAVGQKSPIANGGYQEVIDHAIKLDMAKELCMIQRNEKGKQARQYFISIEKAWNSPEMIMKRALEIVNRNVQKLKLDNIEKDKQLQEQQPKVEFVDHISSSQNSLLVREIAKVISKKGIKKGERKLYEKLRMWGLIFKNSCEATQKAINQGFMEVVEGSRSNGTGTFTFKTTRVTGKGQVYIFNKLKEVQ